MTQTEVERQIRRNMTYERDTVSQELLALYGELSDELRDQVNGDVLKLRERLRLADERRESHRTSYRTAFEIVMRLWMYMAREKCTPSDL